VLSRDWGYIITPGRSFTAPVWVNEFGTFHDCRKQTCEKWWPDFLRYLSEGDFDWAIWRADGTNSRNSKQKEGNEERYGILDKTWTKPAFHSEMLHAVQTIMASKYGPGVTPNQCKHGCSDVWDPTWPNGRKGASACSVCIRNYHCRAEMTPQAWCEGQWAQAYCGQTCCMASFISVDSCSASASWRGEELGSGPEAPDFNMTQGTDPEEGSNDLIV